MPYRNHPRTRTPTSSAPSARTVLSEMTMILNRSSLFRRSRVSVTPSPYRCDSAREGPPVGTCNPIGLRSESASSRMLWVPPGGVNCPGDETLVPDDREVDRHISDSRFAADDGDHNGPARRKNCDTWMRAPSHAIDRYDAREIPLSKDSADSQSSFDPAAC